MIIYQIYPRSFRDSDGDGVGDLKGIAEKLDYVAKLGVDMVWISPFFKSPMKDFGYDVSDYRAVDPLFGTMADFDAVLEKANELGLKLMLDLVLSHSSDEHPWFQESRASRTNAKADWYVWADARPDGSAPNNWLSLFGGPAWAWDRSRGQFYLHSFLVSQPDFNFHQRAVQDALLAECEFWFKKGVKGLRLDVCNHYFHSAALENNPPRPDEAARTDGVHAGNPYNLQRHIFDKDRPENVGFLKRLRALADRYEGTALMGEVVSDDGLKIMSDYVSDGGSAGYPLHTAYSFALFRNRFDARAFAAILNEVEERMPSGSPSWALGNHDVPRFASRFGSDLSPEAIQLYLSFLCVLRGTVILYQGDELGLEEAEIPRHLMQDPFGIEFYPEFKGRDGCRTPMPWSRALASEKSWLPIPRGHLEKSVEVQEKSAGSMLAFTRGLLQWRKENRWLEGGRLRARADDDNAVLVIEREGDEGERLTAVFNPTPEPKRYERAGGGQAVLRAYGFEISGRSGLSL